MLIWLLLTMAAAGGLVWQQHNSREALAQRFQLRVGLIGDFVTSYTADLIARERVQADASLTDRTVNARDFARAVAGFGYPAAVLIDDRGRALQVIPPDPSVIGRDLAGRYAHLRTALRQGRPAVSPVVPSAAEQNPVVAFAVPFATSSGRRVFSGAVDIKHSPLTAYLTTALSFAGARVQLVDAVGNVVAANRALTGSTPTLAGADPSLAAALRRHGQGRYHAAGRWWRYSSAPIAGTPWRLSAAVREDVLFASLAGNETAGHAGLGGAAVVGLLVVAAAARARRSRQDLQLSEDRFRRVFDGSRIGMTLTDTEGRFLRVNPAASQMLGRTEDDLIGTSCAEVIHPDDRPAATVAGRDCLAGRADGFDLDKRYLRADGATLDTSVTGALLRDRHGRPQYFTTQIVDMTERRALERVRSEHEAELAQRAEQLQEANAHLADFMAMLSHDVRQPLAGIVGLGELLLDDWPEIPDEDKLSDVRRMTAAGHRAADLVTDILTLAQLDAGALAARAVRIDVSHAVREAVAAHQGGHSAPITVVAPDQTEGLADPAHLQLILGNLLANAAKYGRPPITVTVCNRRDQIMVDVSDHGEGVPEEFVPHLFERFTRADTGVATTAPGTGLGLYLVSQLARAGGLSISYAPTRPTGATFTIAVPCMTPRLGGVSLPRPAPTRRH
ncbi:ATP-binding protein [Actinoplanes sp. NPDC051343]|uniref:sensor histidine kinase n=1 Tax=Actinoplanes sp. NPDC051343 TaxID=3363906 RepID=UPI0037B331E5